MPKRITPLLFALLLLIAAACSKKEEPKPAPEPALEGTWKVQHTQVTEYNADGSILRQSGTVTPLYPTSYIFTPSQFTIQTPSSSAVYTYTRDKSILRSQHQSSGNNLQHLIKSLTKSELVLEETGVHGAGSGPIVVTTHLTR